MNKKRKRKLNYFSRLLLVFFFFLLIICTLGYTFINDLSSLYDIYQQKAQLNNRILELAEEEEVINSDIKRLSDPVYIAKYAREKYFYSKPGEIILRINE